jgi:hypothetical protein
MINAKSLPPLDERMARAVEAYRDRRGPAVDTTHSIASRFAVNEIRLQEEINRRLPQ